LNVFLDVDNYAFILDVENLLKNVKKHVLKNVQLLIDLLSHYRRLLIKGVIALITYHTMGTE
jgi:hypothetical protein